MKASWTCLVLMLVSGLQTQSLEAQEALDSVIERSRFPVHLISKSGSEFRGIMSHATPDSLFFSSDSGAPRVLAIAEILRIDAAIL